MKKIVYAWDNISLWTVLQGDINTFYRKHLGMYCKIYTFQMFLWIIHRRCMFRCLHMKSPRWRYHTARKKVTMRTSHFAVHTALLSVVIITVTIRAYLWLELMKQINRTATHCKAISKECFDMNAIYFVKWCKIVEYDTGSMSQHSSVCWGWDCLGRKYCTV